MQKIAVLVVGAALLLAGCKNKDYEKCLQSVDEYDKARSSA